MVVCVCLRPCRFSLCPCFVMYVCDLFPFDHLGRLPTFQRGARRLRGCRPRRRLLAQRSHKQVDTRIVVLRAKPGSGLALTMDEASSLCLGLGLTRYIYVYIYIYIYIYQLSSQRRTFAHLGNQDCCVHIHTVNLSVAVNPSRRGASHVKSIAPYPGVHHWPLHDIFIATIVCCVAYKREPGRGVVYCPIVVHWYSTRVGNAGGRGGMKGWLSRAQQPRSKRISCKGLGSPDWQSR